MKLATNVAGIEGEVERGREDYEEIFDWGEALDCQPLKINTDNPNVPYYMPPVQKYQDYWTHPSTLYELSPVNLAH
eukprot:10719434-Ditylum_brightwellii.AAC.2